MAVREYIGARYVPIFANPAEWNDARNYEPLTIVLHEGNSYTSRQYVPAGIAISNEDYWLETGNYNAQIEAYRNEVQQFGNRIDAAENAVLEVQGDIGELNVAVAEESNRAQAAEQANAAAIAAETERATAALTAEGERLNGVIAAETERATAAEQANAAAIAAETARAERAERDLAATISKSGSLVYDYYKDRNIVFIGDSYSYGTGASDHLAGDTKRFTSLLTAMLGGTEFNYAVGSTGFCDPGSAGQNMTFAQQLDAADADMTYLQKSETHLVVIAGGFNDWNEGSAYGYGSMKAAATECAIKATSYFPNAHILFVPMLFKGWGVNSRTFNFEAAICDGVAGVSRANYIRGAWTWNHGAGARFVSDHLHPNDAGHLLIAQQIYANITGGFAYRNETYSIQWAEGYSCDVASGGYLQFFNGTVSHQGMYVYGTFETGNHKVADVTKAVCGLAGVYGIIIKGNAIAGSYAITTNGVMYVNNTSGSNITDCYFTPISYIPSGSEYTTE